MSQTFKFPEQLTEHAVHFMENTPVARLRRNLRNLLLEHLLVQKDGHCFNLDDLLFDMLNLFELLDAIESIG